MENLLRRRLITALPLAPLLSLAACAALDPNTVTLGPEELERVLQRQFPVERRLLDLFEVTLATPRLQLLPERNRIAAVMDLRARERVLAGSWHGQLSFDAALRWNAADQTLRLHQVRVQDLALVDPASPLRHAGERIAAALAERVIEDLAVYRVSSERWSDLQRRGVMPGSVQVTRRGVEIRFVPMAR